MFLLNATHCACVTVTKPLHLSAVSGKVTDPIAFKVTLRNTMRCAVISLTLVCLTNENNRLDNEIEKFTRQNQPATPTRHFVQLVAHILHVVLIGHAPCSANTDQYIHQR